MRQIIHADFDAFYASVEQLDNPHLRDRPVVVGGSPEDRGVVASASYEARRFGVRSAMPMRTALRLCPDAIRAPVNFSRYREVSRRVMAIFREYTPLVEPLSLDEAYLDVTASIVPGRDAVDIARQLRSRVKEDLGLTISVGVATSKSVAKIASDLGKPDGFKVVPSGSERDFLEPLSVGRLWGVGPKSVERLNAGGIHTIGDLASQTDEWFTLVFGRTGSRIHSLALGNDDSAVVVERETKSISSESTFPQDTGDRDVLLEMVNRLSQDVARGLRGSALRGRTVKIKLRLSDFTTLTRQKTLSEPVESSEDIARAAGSLLESELVQDRRFRLVGVGVSGFDDRRHKESQGEAVQLKLAGFQ